MINRRTFVAAAAAATLVAAPGIAWGQEKRRIAIVNAVRPLEFLRAYPAVSEFRQELERREYAEGKNLVIDYTSGAGREDQVAYLREVVASKPEVIFVMTGIKSALDLMRITETIPIVTGHPGPVAAGLGRRLISSQPDTNGRELDHGHVIRGQLVVARGDAAEVFDLVEEALHEVARLVEIGAEADRVLAV